MNDLQLELMLRFIMKKVDIIDAKQNALLEQISALSTAYAKQNGLVLEEEEMECEYINDVE